MKDNERNCKLKGALLGRRHCLVTESPLKMIKNVLFHFKSFFRSRDTKTFFLTFWSCGRTS